MEPQIFKQVMNFSSKIPPNLMLNDENLSVFNKVLPETLGARNIRKHALTFPSVFQSVISGKIASGVSSQGKPSTESKSYNL